MNRVSPAAVMRGAGLAFVMIAWAVLAHINSAGSAVSDVGLVLALAPLLAAAMILLWRVGDTVRTVIGGLVAIGLLAWLWASLRQNVALVYFIQHLGTNLALGALFGRSLTFRQNAVGHTFCVICAQWRDSAIDRTLYQTGHHCLDRFLSGQRQCFGISILFCATSGLVGFRKSADLSAGLADVCGRADFPAAKYFHPRNVPGSPIPFAATARQCVIAPIRSPGTHEFFSPVAAWQP